MRARIRERTLETEIMFCKALQFTRMSFGILLSTLATATLCSCGKSPDVEAGLAKTPEEAASHMEQAFSAADAQMRELAKAASEALRKNEFESAVVSLQSMKANPEMTPDQRMAIYGSAVTLEARLIGAIQSGDKNAERAYQLLKEMKRN